MSQKQRKPNKNTKLTKQVSLQIRRLYLSGLKIIDIQEKLGISPNTWDAWYNRDTQGFRVKFIDWRREKMMNKAESNLDEFMNMPTEIQVIEDSDDEQGERAVVVTDSRLLKIKLDATTFGLETLGKETYSKKILQVDPNAATREEIDEMRRHLKNMMGNMREKNHGSHKDKMLAAVK